MLGMIGDIACPVLGVDSEFHHAVERRIWPVSDPRYKLVLHRVDVNVIDMPHEIVPVTNCMLPIASLPNATFAFGGAAV